ncbi:hypothetical protein A0H81_08421 [Grifola frondosa]|uniref:Uncharacterized protein n=1 Tax=Grifola frondosa TaxID=5627 RepID=A0A1C7M3K9_GRIFR|nr:hypothetical protein A0H81_08421 [Grifola frondosa]
MSFIGFDDSPGWGVPVPTTGDIIKDAIRKDQLVKEIVGAQEDLRALQARVKAVEADIEKLTSGNETLQMYIDNLTLQMAKRR